MTSIPAHGRIELTVDPEHAGERLDRYLAQRLEGVSRTRVKDLILTGQVTEGDDALEKPNHKVAADDVITIDVPPPDLAEPQPEDIALDIRYEDADLIVIDKPAGLVVHPAPGHWTGTLVNALLHHCAGSLSGIGGVKRPGIVHRLDKDTSGLMVVAKSDRAHQGLAAQFADHGRNGPLEREYRAFAWGVPDKPRFTIEAAIGRDPRNRLKMAVVSETAGRHAVTHVTRLGAFGGVVSDLACALETGRTHQIRLHLSHAGHSLLCDDTYGGGFKTKAKLLSPEARGALEALGRQALHARLLGFAHPATGETLRFESALPTDMARLARALAAM